jgi:hypothetical protein
MRRTILSMTVALLCAASAPSQATRPQTARQALLEMFFSKEPGTFVKHLPAATRAALEKAGALSNLQQSSAMMAQLQTQGKGLQTFETGSILLVAENPAAGQKVQITVEKDAMRGDRDDIELSFLIYKSGQAERTPFMPQLTFSMKQEEQMWKLNEISITIHVPLADPDFLKAVTEKMTPATQPRPTITLTSSPQSETPVQAGASDATVLAAMHTILAAEATYASSYPNVGYTCSLSSLDGFGGGEPNEHQAMLINSGLASGKKYGFVFTLSGCSAAPATNFHLSAAPNANTFGRKAFCADQSGVIRSAQDGSSATCWASGTVAQ